MFPLHDFLVILFIASSIVLLIRVVISALFDDLDLSHFIQAFAVFLLLFAANELSLSSADASAHRVTCDAMNGAEGEAYTWHCTLIHP